MEKDSDGGCIVPFKVPISRLELNPCVHLVDFPFVVIFKGGVFFDCKKGQVVRELKEFSKLRIISVIEVNRLFKDFRYFAVFIVYFFLVGGIKKYKKDLKLLLNLHKLFF
jgi:hypothetical protein